jgi:hypothetical protein
LPSSRLTPNNFENLDAIRLRFRLYEELTNRQPKPFAFAATPKPQAAFTSS